MNDIVQVIMGLKPHESFEVESIEDLGRLWLKFHYKVNGRTVAMYKPRFIEKGTVYPDNPHHPKYQEIANYLRSPDPNKKMHCVFTEHGYCDCLNCEHCVICHDYYSHCEICGDGDCQEEGVCNSFGELEARHALYVTRSEQGIYELEVSEEVNFYSTEIKIPALLCIGAFEKAHQLVVDFLKKNE